MIKNKKVLLICKESFSYPLFFVAKKLLSNNNQVGAYFIHPEEGYYKKCLYNESTFYNFKDNLKDVKLYGGKDLCEKFNEKIKIDYNFLNEIEKEYTHFKNLNLQLTSSQLTTRHLHTRNYFDYSSFDQNLKFLELGYKDVIEVLDDFQPDIILDTDDGELLRTIINEVAFKRGIPFITIDYPRFENYKIPTYCLGVKNEKYFQVKYNEHYSKPESELKEEFDYILEMRNKSNIMSKEYQGTITSQYKADSLYFVFKNLIGKLIYFWNLYIKNGNYKLIKVNRIIYPNPLKYFLFYGKVEYKKQMLYRENKYFETPQENEEYVYMPLHLIPESTTFVKAPFYINELNIIEQISKSLPISWKLYVKEHQSMLGERSFRFYKEVKKFPNVRLVKFNHYTDPKPWIEKSKGVITITGTGAFEAAMLGKKSIVFGDVPFNLISSISKINSFTELPDLISSFKEVDNIKSCAAYLATIKSIGRKINLKYLMSEGEAIVKGEKELSETYENNINTLYDFFEDAFEQYDIRK